jgi:hypothetical protein
MARAARGTPCRRARPATADARTTSEGGVVEGGGVTSASRRGRDCSRHAHGDEISRAVQARRKPVQLFALALFASALLATRSENLLDGDFGLSRLQLWWRFGGPFGVWAESQHKSESFRARAPVCSMLTFRHRGVDKVYWLIHQSEERETACGVPGFVQHLAALSSVYFCTQPNAALLLTH